LELRLAMGFALLMVASGMFCFWYASDYTLLIAGSFLAGLAGGALLPLWGFLLGRAFGAGTVGRVVGLVAFAILPLSLLLPPLFGWVFDKSGSYDHATLLATGAACAVILVVPRIRTQPPASAAAA